MYPKEAIAQIFKIGNDWGPHFGSPFKRCFLQELPDL